ncbi:MAG: four helix bundle protein [Candidatus Saccharimonadales bacterium]|nr:four helix bundle protein [Candidatus Saccharibacteria bacterium]
MSQRYYDLEERFTTFGVSTVTHFRTYKDPIFRKPIEQVVKSSTSVGANYVEANNGSSRADFRNKIFIAKKEASETRYWFNFFQRCGDKSQKLCELQDEIQQIIMILQKIINTLKSGPGKSSET